MNPAKPGVYGIGLPLPPQKPVMFAPNVTPGTYVEPEDGPDSIESLSSSSTLFPPSEVVPAVSRRRRAPPGKRLSLGYIPRPPNAFMLFRADFVRQKHVPGSIETNHGSLSKIIGGKFNLSFDVWIFYLVFRQLLEGVTSRGKTCLGG